MTPFAVSRQYITTEDLKTFEQVRRMVQLLPDHDKMTCHVVARLAMPLARDFRLVDGLFLYSPHSWLRRGDTVIDPYPWAAAEPHIVTLGDFSPWRHIYKEHPLPEEAAAALLCVSRLRAGLPLT